MCLILMHIKLTGICGVIGSSKILDSTQAVIAGFLTDAILKSD